MVVVDMTEDSITEHPADHSIPLILGNMFQPAYSTVNSIIAGRFIGKEALAAEDMISLVMNTVILGISGVCMGVSVLMSEFYGVGQKEKLEREASTTVIFDCYFPVIIVTPGGIFSESPLETLGVSDEILDKAAFYLSIIFLGAPFIYFYNTVSAALKSVGDSKTSFKFLAFSSILNTVLDLIFIGGLGFDTACLAVTAAVAGAASAVLYIAYVYRKIPMLQLRRGKFTVDGQLLKQAPHYGSTTALQQSCQPIGKPLIQDTTNPLDMDMTVIFNTVNRIDDYASTPEWNISHGTTTLVAQNRGVDRKERIGKGFRRGFIPEVRYWVSICITITLFRRPFMGLSVTTGNKGIVVSGSGYLGLVALFYMFPAFVNGIQGFLRGMGDMSVALLGVFVQTSPRVVFVYLSTSGIGLLGVAYACAIDRSVILSVETPYYLWFMKDK